MSASTKTSKIEQLKRHLFLEHIRKSSEVVEKWPSWKKNMWDTPKPPEKK